jgi:AraC-like DNA-binding protein
MNSNMASRRLPSSRLVFGQKDFGLPGVVMFGRYQHAAAVSAIAPHVHPGEFEICFLERGEQTFRVKGLLHRMRGNDQFFTLPDEVHDTANLPEERGILYWLILKVEPTRKFLGLAEAQAAQLKRELHRMPTRHFRGHPDCGRILGEINDLLVEGRTRKTRLTPYRQLRLQSLLLQYLTLTMEASQKGLHGAASPLMQRVLHYIDAHLDEPVSVRELVKVSGLSESRCKSRFKREIGVPPAEFWLRKKIERAIVLLKNRPVTDVAYDLGFSSSQYFATVFKRYTLVNPSQFHIAKK